MADKLHQVYLARGALATTAIEGNTLSEGEAIAIVQEKSNLPKSQAYLEKEIKNILSASNAMLEKIERDGIAPITPNDIKQYNKTVLDGLEVAPHVTPGECVKTDVEVAGYHGAPWQECEDLLAKLCAWLNGENFGSRDGDGIIPGILKAILAHLYLVWIHPFGDGNGRTARLLEVRFLTEAGVPSAAGHLLSNFYNKTRTEYYRKLGEASKSGGNVIAFLVYAVTGFVDELREQLKIVKNQQWYVSWQNYVYEAFEGRNSVSDKRQLKLALALTKQGGFVPKTELRHLTPALAEAYAGKTDKTLTRDLNELANLGLIERTKDGYRATKEIILAFLPRGRKGSVEDQLRDASFFFEDGAQSALDL
ncbi:MAG TPA: Fic family protein [Rhizomicrobium sp.]